MSERQKKRLEKELKAHKHDDYEVDIRFDENNTLEGFIVQEHVLRPEKMVAIVLARWLLQNKELYKEKKVIDMGSGSGIQGVMMGLNGANSITFTDISPDAVENSRMNAKKFKLEKYKALRGDLFENITEKADVIIFNHPFFNRKTDEALNKSMIGKTIHNFLEDAKEYLETNGFIIMPYFHLAGKENDPREQAGKHGYEVEILFHERVETPLQKGPVSIYKLKPQS